MPFPASEALHNLRRNRVLAAEKYKAHILKYVPCILKYLRPFFEKVPEGFSGLFYGN